MTEIKSFYIESAGAKTANGQNAHDACTEIFTLWLKIPCDFKRRA